MTDREPERSEAHTREDRSSSLLTLAEDLLPRSGRALDLACGTGGGALALARRGFRVDAVDRSLEAVREVVDRARGEGLRDRIRPWVEDLDRPSFAPAARYALVHARRFFLPHLPALARDALEPGGWFLLEALHDGTSPRRGRPEQWLARREDLLCGFSIFETRLAGFDPRFAFLVARRPGRDE